MAFASLNSAVSFSILLTFNAFASTKAMLMKIMPGCTQLHCMLYRAMHGVHGCSINVWANENVLFKSFWSLSFMPMHCAMHGVHGHSINVGANENVPFKSLCLMLMHCSTSFHKKLQLLPEQLCMSTTASPWSFLHFLAYTWRHLGRCVPGNLEHTEQLAEPAADPNAALMCAARTLRDVPVQHNTVTIMAPKWWMRAEL